MRSMKSAISLCLLCCLLLGCGEADNRPEVASVSGTVTYNGEPVAGATVVFTAADAPTPSHGKTDASGAFTLTTYDDGDGAIVGENVVTVTKIAGDDAGAEDVDLDDPSAGYDEMMGGGDDTSAAEAAPANELPAKYASTQTSPLKETVESGSNNFPIELTDE